MLETLLRKSLLAALELFYGPLAPLYPWLTRIVFGRNWHDWRRSVLPWVSATRRVADVGCGPGDLAAELARPDRCVIAIDRSRSMIALAHRRLARKSGPFSVYLVCADARHLPLTDGSLDAITMTFPTAIFLDSRTHAEVARVLRPGGVFVAVVSVYPKQWPWWIRPWSPLLWRIIVSREKSSRSMLAVPSLPLLRGQWIRVEQPTGILELWVARRVEQDAG
ncbi:class I SAM-dependent methyltransferase [Thermomicrobium sp. 4228-Ro]|uniref:class I SAM-dependent methyltransferase n=1 Tax=Thermomicrobium sp. 4228-Ro TaxID=2993937 RepID=UPI0022498193|nr:class I SAM-dependent methyltransferase [Thermomicrobium sp. 4228-Ro]MCX2726106.1 class I SAM-dependent methyltransferase [Thermomicrobium sp. 4228-Ro]